MERISTTRTPAKKATLLVLALAVMLAVYANPLRGLDSEGSSDPAAGAPEENAAPSANVPEDKTLKLTIPKMARVKDLPVHDAPADDEATLGESALHVEGTGFPWEEEVNVYIAGHRLGYEGTRSHLVFHDLDVLAEGDEIFLTDANGTRYTYRVFESFVAGPRDYVITEPMQGKNILSLQTCTLPNFAERFVVRAEFVEVS